MLGSIFLIFQTEKKLRITTMVQNNSSAKKLRITAIVQNNSSASVLDPSTVL